MTKIIKNGIIEEGIFEDGYVKNTVLHRRWVMAQTFRLLSSYKGWDHAVNNHMEYSYQFYMMLDELKVQYKLYETNDKAYKERNMFFNKSVVLETCEKYKERIERSAISKMIWSRNNKTYDVLVGRNRMSAEHFYRFYLPAIVAGINRIKHSDSPKELYESFKVFVDNIPKIDFLDRQKDLTWKDAYKGAGAYYTLKNMIKFHNCVIEGMNQEESLRELDELLYGKYKYEVWRFHILLLEVIKHNNFDYKNRMEECYK